jgi:integrase
MAVTVKLLLRESKARADGKAPVWLRVTANRKSRYLSSGVYVDPGKWNEGRAEVRKSHPLASSLNARLTDFRLEAERIALEVDTAQAVKARLDGSGGTFTAYLESFVEKLDEEDKFWEQKKYAVTRNKVQECLGERVAWEELDSDAIAEFERHCRKERGNNVNTTRKELSRFRRVVRQAVKDGTIQAADNPFLGYDLPKRQPVERRRLSFPDVQALKELDFAPGSEVALARDTFLFAFYGGGIRFGDVCCLKPDDIAEGRLRYRMMKTDKPVEVKLPEHAHEIARRWKEDDHPFLFPLLEKGDDRSGVYLRKRISVWNVIVNRNLKKAARQADIRKPDDVTFHVARHTFADFARRKSGDLYAISKALGHSNLRITERYLSSFDRDAVDRLTDDLWNDE